MREREREREGEREGEREREREGARPIMGRERGREALLCSNIRNHSFKNHST